MKLKKLSVGLMTAVLTAGLLASPAMASEVTDAAAVQNGTVTVQAAATENGAAGTGTSDDIQGEIKDTGKDDAENGSDQGEGKEDTGKDDGKGNTGKDDGISHQNVKYLGSGKRKRIYGHGEVEGLPG